MAERSDSPSRLFIPNFLSLDQCKELEFIHKSSSTLGYRPNVFSTTLSHLIATNCPQLIVPLVPIREMLKEKVEEFFRCEYELCVEFTGLISWSSRKHKHALLPPTAGPKEQALDGTVMIIDHISSKGTLRCVSMQLIAVVESQIYKENLDHEFSTLLLAVCYLNSHGKSFKGGLFHFRDGELLTVVPSAGDLLIYTADSRNIHSVDEVTDGERITLTLWFSRNSTHDEDVKLISRLSQIYSSLGTSGPPVPAPASSNMYLFSRDQSSHEEFGINICFARLLVLGFSIYSAHSENDLSEPHDLLLKPLQLTRGDELFDSEFSNILHALQVVQYYFWKALDLPCPESELGPGKVTKLSTTQKDKVNKLKLLLVKDHKLAWEVFNFTCHKGIGLQDFNWTCFSVAVSVWEDYTSEKHENLLMSLPHWRNHQSMFCASFDGI